MLQVKVVVINVAGISSYEQLFCMMSRS